MAKKRLGEILVEHGLITPDQVERALKYQNEAMGHHVKFGEALVALNILSEVRLYQVLSRIFNLPLIDLAQIEVPAELVQMIPHKFAEDQNMLPLKVVDHQKRRFLCIAVSDPTRLETVDMLQAKTGMVVKMYLAPPSHLLRAIGETYRRGMQEVELHAKDEVSQAIIMRGANQGVEEVWATKSQDEEKTKVFTMQSTKPGAPATGVPRVRVDIIAGMATGKQFHLKPIGEMIIGRSPQVDIHIQDDHLSRQHAKVVTTGNLGVWVVDLESLNGTHVNGERVNGKQRLRNGDLIQIGNNALRVTAE